MKKLTALFLAAVMCLGFAACGGDKPSDDTTTTTESTTAPSITDPTGGADSATEATEPPAADPSGSLPPTEPPATDPSGNTLPTTTAAPAAAGKDPTAPPPSGINAPVGKGAAEVLAFYNTAANKIKTVPLLKLNIHKQQTVSVPKPLNGALDFLVADAQIDETKNRTFTNGKDAADGNRSVNDVVIPEGKSYVSILKAADVASAACKALPDGRYEVLIKMPNVTVGAEEVPSNYAAGLNVLEVKLSDIEAVHVSSDAKSGYSNGELRAVINQDGQMDELHMSADMMSTGKLSGNTTAVKAILFGQSVAFELQIHQKIDMSLRYR